jgi:hypothetical protein
MTVDEFPPDRDMTSRLEQLCLEKGLKMTEQRRVVARVLSDSADHPMSSRFTGAPPRSTRGSASPRSIGRCACSRKRTSSPATISAMAARGTRRCRTPTTTI